MGGGVFGVEIEGALERLNGLVAAAENGEEEADFILNGGGLGIECGGVAVGGESACGVARGFEGGRAGDGFPRRFGGERGEREAKKGGEETHAGIIIREVRRDAASSYSKGIPRRGLRRA